MGCAKEPIPPYRRKGDSKAALEDEVKESESSENEVG
jgi:hypothetical protein